MSLIGSTNHFVRLLWLAASGLAGLMVMIFFSGLCQRHSGERYIPGNHGKAPRGPGGPALFCRSVRRSAPGQNQIKGGDAVVQGAGRYSQQRHLAYIGRQEHSPRQDGGAVINLAGPSPADGMAGDIIGVDAHAAADQEQTATPIQLGAYQPRNESGIIRSEIHSRHF